MSEAYRRHPLQALGLAVLIESILLVVAAVVLARATAARPMAEPTPIVLTEQEAELKKLPKPEPPKPKLAPSKPAPKQVVPPIPQPPLPEPVKATPPAPVVTSPTAFTEPVPPPPAPPPPTPTPSSDSAKMSAEYAAKVRAAVQAAHYYPPAAAALRYSGRVRVEFHLRDALPGEARLLSPSSIGIIDRAALDAVQRAQYPLPPPALKGADLVYEVWVEFYH
jgi:protein TonB